MYSVLKKGVNFCFAIFFLANGVRVHLTGFGQV